MYRLLIVDDEEIIANGLFEIFRTLKHLDLDVYKAYSGEQAIEWLNRTRIDIVLTDIQMPNINGIQLLEQIYKSWPNCKVVFLSGYSEFEYVYKAIQHPGVSYVLKTESHEKVIETVEKAISDIQKEVKTEDLVYRAKEQIRMATELFQKDFFLHLLNDDASICLDPAQFEKLETSLQPEAPIHLLLGNLTNVSQDLCYWERMEQLYAVQQLIGQYLVPRVHTAIVIDEKYQFVLFVQPKEKDDNLGSFLRGTLESIQRVCVETLNIAISFAMGSKPVSWSAVSGLYSSLSQRIHYRIGNGLDSFIVDDEYNVHIAKIKSPDDEPCCHDESSQLRIILKNKKTASVEHYLESGQQDKYFSVVEDVLDKLKKITDKNNLYAAEAYYSLSLALLSYINRWKLAEVPEFLHSCRRLMNYEEFPDWNSAAEYIIELSRHLFVFQNEDEKKRADNTIEYIKEFILGHLDEDLSLVRLAEQVFLNPSYLSRLFKQTSGMNISDFIESERIRTAKELLGQKQYRIHEVALRIGYENAASFTRVFKKVCGLSPQEYRDSCLLGKQ